MIARRPRQRSPGLPEIHRVPINGRIGKGDLLEILLPDWAGPNTITVRRVRVAQDGTVNLYLFDVKLEGLTPAEAPGVISRACISHFVECSGDAVVERIEKAADSKVQSGPLAKGDLIELSLGDVTGPGAVSDHYVRIEEDGTIPVPLLRSVKVAGLEEAAAERAIADKYRDENLITNAAVGVLKVQDERDVRVKAGPVQKGDLLRVSLIDVQAPISETTLDVRVGQDGRVGLPLVGGVAVAGRSVPDAIRDIATAYEKRKIAEYMSVWLLRIESADQSKIPLGPIQPGDLLNVFVGGSVSYDRRPWNRPVRVSENGTISLPHVRDLRVGGLSELQAQESIEHELRERVGKAVVSVLKLEPS